ncbi:MAG: hypothetical protein PHF25_09170 [Candidatus Margulisbacteria bacterium]|nr:hypothetical protein [Candidatus Margulisiibacteriota bacterium]
MAIPVGYRKITSNDVGKTFGVDLETVIKFDDAISVGSWYINAEPPFSSIEWMLFSDSSSFYSSRGGNPNFWMIDTYFRGSYQSGSEGVYPYPDDYIISTSETVPSGITIMDT